jgi:ribulose-phosphate 3-epimerase
MIKICPSVLSADFSKLRDEIEEVEAAGADMIHCDIMDGNFVPNISFGPGIISFINEITDLPLDVHLMINNPERFISDFCKAGADYISVHVENNIHLHRVIMQIKEHEIKAGVAINPATSNNSLNGVIEYVDFINVMSVNPGFGGQKFIPGSLAKIKELRKKISESLYVCDIEVDGGVTLDNIKEIAEAGANIFVCGNSVFKADDKAKVIKEMKAKLKV